MSDEEFTVEQVEELLAEFEQALASEPDKWRKNPDGTWTEIGYELGGESQ